MKSCVCIGGHVSIISTVCVCEWIYVCDYMRACAVEDTTWWEYATDYFNTNTTCEDWFIVMNPGILCAVREWWLVNCAVITSYGNCNLWM